MSTPLPQGSIIARTQACVPCAKRKVKCDRQEPCANCRRRKTDVCTYLEVSANERIKKLEALVRNLGGDPDGTDQHAGSQVAQGNIQDGHGPSLAHRQHDNHSQLQKSSAGCESAQQGGESVIIKEDEDAVYLESYVFHDCFQKHRVDEEGLHGTAGTVGMSAPSKASKHHLRKPPPYRSYWLQWAQMPWQAY